MAVSNVKAVHDLNDQVQVLTSRSYADLNATSKAASQAESMFAQADHFNGQVQSAAQKANAILSDAGDQVKAIGSFNDQVAGSNDADSNAKIARSDADQTAQTSQSVIKAASVADHDYDQVAGIKRNLTSQYQSGVDVIVAAQMKAQSLASLASQYPNDAQIQLANSIAQSAASVAYQQAKVTQSLAKTIQQIDDDAAKQALAIDDANSQASLNHSTAESAAQIASQAALHGDNAIASSARAVADLANQKALALQTGIQVAQDQLRHDVLQSQQLLDQFNTAQRQLIQTSQQVDVSFDQVQHLLIRPSATNNDAGFTVVIPSEQPGGDHGNGATFKLKYYGLDNLTLQTRSYQLLKITNLKALDAKLAHHYVGQTVQFKLNGQIHNRFNFTAQNAVKNVKAGTKFKVQGVDVYHGVARFLIGHHQWITANVNYVEIVNH